MSVILAVISDVIAGSSKSLMRLHAVYSTRSARRCVLAGVCLVGIVVWVEMKTRAVARARTIATEPDAALT